MPKATKSDKTNEPIFEPNDDKKVNGIINIANPIIICRNDLSPSIAKMTIAAQKTATIPPIKIFLVVLLMFLDLVH